MPTVGWIREGDEDEYFSATETHEVTPRSFPCPLCGLELDSSEALGQHLRLGHPKRRPDLRIDGLSQPRNIAVRKLLTPDRVQLVDVSKCSVSINGASHRFMSVRALRARICGETYATWDILLFNESKVDDSESKARYRIEFKIPTDADLQTIESTFLSRFSGLSQLNYETIEQFRSDVKVNDQSTEYVDALANYCLATCLRGRPNTSLEDIANLLKSAHVVVSDFSGRLPAAVTAAINFSLNYFHGKSKKARCKLLDIGISYFIDKSRCRESKGILKLPMEAERSLCPIDACSIVLLNACAAALGSEPFQTITILEDLSLDTLTAQDRTKAWVLYADAYLMLDRKAEAVPYLQRLQHDYLFGRWAREELEGIENQC